MNTLTLAGFTFKQIDRSTVNLPELSDLPGLILLQHKVTKKMSVSAVKSIRQSCAFYDFSAFVTNHQGRRTHSREHGFHWDMFIGERLYTHAQKVTNALRQSSELIFSPQGTEAHSSRKSKQYGVYRFLIDIDGRRAYYLSATPKTHYEVLVWLNRVRDGEVNRGTKELREFLSTLPRKLLAGDVYPLSVTETFEYMMQARNALYEERRSLEKRGCKVV
jgi:dipeptidyl aminopeptidase/acylaminoacyl peptidase